MSEAVGGRAILRFFVSPMFVAILRTRQPSDGGWPRPGLVAPPTARTPRPSTPSTIHPSSPPLGPLIKVSHVSQPIRADLFDQIRIISSVQNPMALSSHP